MLFHIVEKKKRSRPMSPKAQMEQEKRMRREIANSNERRRMQCINAGFQSLRALMPQLSGEKLSKAAILQHTTEYIAKLEQEQKRHLSQNEQLKRMLMEYGRAQDIEQQNESPPPKRKKRDTECSDEGIGMLETVSESTKEQLQTYEELHREMIELRQQLENERSLRQHMEERNRSLEAQCVHHQAPSPRSTHISHLSPPMHHLNSPINLKVESPVHKTISVQEVSAVHHEERTIITPELPPSYHNLPPARRNLENLVEAIRQIEGDRALCDDSHFCFGNDRERSQPMAPMAVPVLHSEDSEKESSISELDDCKSESSSRDSPSPLRLCAQRLQISAAAVVQQPHMAHMALSEKYPIASTLLHRPYHGHSYSYRPGVIVHKS